MTCLPIKTLCFLLQTLPTSYIFKAYVLAFKARSDHNVLANVRAAYEKISSTLLYVLIRGLFYVKNPEKALSELMPSVCLAHGTYV